MTRRSGGPLTAAFAPDLAAHEHRSGPLPWQGGRGRLLPAVEASGLTGRGGAGFPTWRKLTAVASGSRPVVVANGAEGEPASAKDLTLLTHAPHLVLDGLQLAAEAVGSDRAYVYAKAGPGADAVRRVVAERVTRGWDRYPVEIIATPDTFLAGEESAIVARLEGRPARPRHRRRLIVEAGVRGRPTLVQNVETLAHLALIARYGAAWFRRLGTPAEPGTFLGTVSGACATPGVVEAPLGLPVGELVGLADGPTGPLAAILVGGYHGAWLPADPGCRIPMSREALASWGASPGAGVVIALPAGTCGLDATARIAGYLAEQSARQCGPCLNGLPAIAATLRRLADGTPDPELVARLDRLVALVDGRGACRHPDGTSRLIRSAMRTFAGDVAAHLHGSCLEAA